LPLGSIRPSLEPPEDASGALATQAVAAS
jgi:hypothetical protein